MNNPVLFHFRKSDSFLSSLNPLFKFVVFILSAVLISFLPEVFVFSFTAVLISGFVYLKIPVLKMMKSNLFFITVSVIMFVAEYNLTLSFFHSSVKSIRYLNLVMLCIIFTDCTSVFDLSFELSKIKFISGFVRVMSLSLIFIPLATDIISRSVTVYRARNFSLLRHPVRAFSYIMVSGIRLFFDKISYFDYSLQARLYYRIDDR